MKKFTSKITQLTATYSFAITYFVMLIIFYTITRNEFFILITGGGIIKITWQLQKLINLNLKLFLTSF